MTAADMIEQIRENYPDLLLADGFEDAVIGVVEGAARGPVVCYDYFKCVQILVERDGMDEETAEEFIDFNVTGAYVGPETPLFLHDWRSTQLEESMTPKTTTTPAPAAKTPHQPFAYDPNDEAADPTPGRLLDKLRSLEDDWDGEDSPAPSEEAIALAEAVLATPGQAVPTHEGGVQIEWHTPLGSVELVITSEGTQELE